MQTPGQRQRILPAAVCINEPAVKRKTNRCLRVVAMSPKLLFVIMTIIAVGGRRRRRRVASCSRKKKKGPVRFRRSRLSSGATTTCTDRMWQSAGSIVTAVVVRPHGRQQPRHVGR